MKPTTKIFIGGVVRNEEAAFIRELVGDLSSSDLLILANFLVGGHQVDFVVITPSFAALLELKNFTRPVSGQINGAWTIRDAAGKDVPASNPYRQALDEAFALSDEMRSYGHRRSDVPPPRKQSYYSNFRTFVCVYPALHHGSRVTGGDHRVGVASYSNIREQIRSGRLDSSWNIPDWERFAISQLHLTPVSLDAATDEKALDAQNDLNAYRARLAGLISTNLAPMIDPDDNATYGARLIAELRGSSNYLLFGPTGSTKTFHLHHFALGLIDSGSEVPLLLDSKRYRGGDFWTFLRQSIAPFFIGDPKSLLTAAKQNGRRAVALLDALNECEAQYRDDLLKGIQAFALNCDARIVVAGHEGTKSLGGLTVVPIALELPDANQRRRIYAHYAALPISEDLDAFCAGFTNAYDIALAGRCHKGGKPPKTRVEIYDRYVNVRLQPHHRVIAAALLRHLAGRLGDAISVVMTRERCEVLAEEFLTKNDASVGILDALFESGLVQVTADSFAFEHELLLTYFRAEALRRTAEPGPALALELRKPRNADLLSFVLPRLSESEHVAAAIHTASDLRTLVHISEGGCGPIAQRELTRECEQFVAKAASALRSLVINIGTIETKDGKRLISSVEVVEPVDWSKRNMLVCTMLADMLGTSLQDQIFDLIDLSERVLSSAVRSAAARSGVSFQGAWSEAVHQLGGVFTREEMILPLDTLLFAIRNRAIGGSLAAKIGAAEGRARFRSRFLERVNKDPTDTFPYLVLLEGFWPSGDAEDVADELDLVEKALHHKVGSVPLNALRYLRWMYRAVHDAGEPQMQRVRGILEQLDFQDPWLQSEVVELLSCYEVIESPVSLETAKAQFRTIADPTPEEIVSLHDMAELAGETPLHFRRNLAYRYIGSIFEDVYQNVYYEAYTDLTETHKRTVLSMAALQKTYGFHNDWILQELLKLRSPDLLPTFETIASDVDQESSVPQSAVAAFVTAINGCAYYRETPPPYVGNGSPFDDAWRVIGAELFFGFRSHQGAGRRDPFEWTWDRLQGDARFAAGIALHQLEGAGRGIGDRQTVHVDLKVQCARAVFGVAHYCLENRGRLANYLRYRHDDSLITFWIDVLGITGDQSALNILRGLIDDARHGRTALDAIRAIQARETGAHGRP
jgi:hypothetical protein